MPFHVGPLRFSLYGVLVPVSHCAAKPDTLSGEYSADVTVVKAFCNLAVMRETAALSTGDDCEFFLFCEFGGSDNGADALRVNGDGLFGEDMFICLDGGS